jgi:hypothetical protein
MRPCLAKTLHKKGLVEWLKVKALSSNPNAVKKKKKTQKTKTSFPWRLRGRCKGLGTSGRLALWVDEVQVGLAVEDRQQLRNHENILEGPLLYAGQKSCPRLQTHCAQLRPGLRGRSPQQL